MRKLLVVFTLLLSMLALPLLASGLTASATVAPGGAKDAVALCQAADEAGNLDAEGATFGECVNFVKGPSTEQSTNFIAGLCGLDFALELTGTTNKGQCIKVVRTLA